jgi:hypothetical protein
MDSDLIWHINDVWDVLTKWRAACFFFLFFLTFFFSFYYLLEFDINKSCKIREEIFVEHINVAIRLVSSIWSIVQWTDTAGRGDWWYICLQESLTLLDVKLKLLQLLIKDGLFTHPRSISGWWSQPEGTSSHAQTIERKKAVAWIERLHFASSVQQHYKELTEKAKESFSLSGATDADTRADLQTHVAERIAVAI